MQYALIFVLLLSFVFGLGLIARRLDIPYPILFVLGGLGIGMIPILPYRLQLDPNFVFFAIIDKGRGGALAGSLGLINTEPQNLSTEIGFVTIFPAFQRTYVTSNAVGILLRYCLEVPTAPRPGLGLRRVQWVAHALNHPSYNAATRMGFRYEGTIRWHWVLPEGKEGSGSSLREGDPSRGPPRDNKVLSFCADDWENEGREHIERAINRQI